LPNVIADPDKGKAVSELDRAHVFHSWSAQDQITPLPVAGAAGSRFWDYEGNVYLDFASQLVFTNIGHQHPKVVAAIQEQAAKLCTIAPAFANDVRAEAAELITSHAPEGLNRVFFTNGGADAIENAVRMARVHTGRPKVLTAYRSYHGNTATAITMTGDPRRWANEAAGHHDGNVQKFFGPYLYRSSFYATTEAEESERALAHLEQTDPAPGPEHHRRDRAGDGGRHQRHPRPAARLPRRACARCATGTGSSTSRTRSWPGSAAPASGSRSTTGTWPPT
jgi:taurine--2-oxoglutarate transaminase